MMAAVLFSSTLPNAFDTPTMAAAKILQIAQGDARAVEVSGTVTYDPTTNDAYDTEAISLEKLLHGAVEGDLGDLTVLGDLDDLVVDEDVT